MPYDVKFNGRKSQLIIFKQKKAEPPDPNIVINNVRALKVKEIIHLGHKLSEDMYKFIVAKCVAELNKQCNLCQLLC